jgi:hypothetical protein
MINKKKECKGCGDEKYIFSKGLCQSCASKTFKKLGTKPQELKKRLNRIKQVTKKQIEKKQAQREKRDVYFDYHIKLCTHSEESGKPIHSPNKANICHILPKASHPSIDDNLDNYVYLLLKEHERFDYLLFAHKFEEIEKEFKNSSELIWSRFKKVVSLSQETTQLSTALEKYIDGRRKS